jgi:hypothetical protein
MKVYSGEAHAERERPAPSARPRRSLTRPSCFEKCGPVQKTLNNHDLNLYPTNWMTVWLPYHHFRLDSATDALYNIAGHAVPNKALMRLGSRFFILCNT